MAYALTLTRRRPSCDPPPSIQESGPSCWSSVSHGPDGVAQAPHSATQIDSHALPWDSYSVS